MIQNVLRDIGGIGIYGVVSLCLFFLVFVGTLIWAFLHDKTFLKEMAARPLEEEVAPAPRLQPVEAGHE